MSFALTFLLLLRNCKIFTFCLNSSVVLESQYPTLLKKWASCTSDSVLHGDTKHSATRIEFMDAPPPPPPRLYNTRREERNRFSVQENPVLEFCTFFFTLPSPKLAYCGLLHSASPYMSGVFYSITILVYSCLPVWTTQPPIRSINVIWEHRRMWVSEGPRARRAGASRWTWPAGGLYRASLSHYEIHFHVTRLIFPRVLRHRIPPERCVFIPDRWGASHGYPYR